MLLINFSRMEPKVKRERCAVGRLAGASDTGFFHVVQTLVPEVGIVKLRVMTALFEQLGVRTFLDDVAIPQDDDAVRALHGGEAVRDKNAGGLLKDQV